MIRAIIPLSKQKSFINHNIKLFSCSLSSSASKVLFSANQSFFNNTSVFFLFLD